MRYNQRGFPLFRKGLWLRTLLSGFLFLQAQHLFPQNQNNFWYFGFGCGIDFNTGVPLAVTNGNLWTGEGSSAVSDAQGNLLFYTNGIGVYNRIHALMPNGTGLHGASSSTHSAIIVPHPGDTNLFFIFTTTDYAQINGFKYSVVDITQDGGLGDVTIKNVAVTTPVCEKIAVVKHANGNDIWVIVHDWGSNNFLSYLLTAAGFNPVPVVSSCGLVTVGGGGTNNANNSVGQMKLSPDRTMLAVGIFGMRCYELYQFDDSNGIISNAITLPNPESTTTYGAYGVEFSPNSNYLYVKHESGIIFQYDVSIYNATDILASKIQVGTITGIHAEPTGALQLGPDEKIYVAKTTMSWLGAINYPDSAGIACDVQDSAVYLAGKNCNLGLPTLIPNTMNNNSIQASGCPGDSMYFQLANNLSSITSFFWNFGDPTSPANTSAIANPAHLFTGPGSYTVTATTTYQNGQTQILTLQIIVVPQPVLVQADTLSICPGDSVELMVEPGFLQILWSTGSTSDSITVQPANSMLYQVQAFQNNCPVQDSILVLVTQVDPPWLGNDTILCGSKDVIHLVVTGNYTHYQWSTGDTTHDILVNMPGMYGLTVTQDQCTRSDSLHIIYQEEPEIGSDTAICEGEPLVFSANTNAASYLWSSGEQTQSINPQVSGVYSVVISLLDCHLVDSVYLLVKPYPQVELGADTLICPRSTLLLAPFIDGDSVAWSTGDSSLTILISNPGEYWLLVSKAGCLAADSIFIDTIPDPELIIPNVFTPNDDGMNERFPQVDIELTDYSLQVFNRWGNLVFSSESPEKNWDGTIKNITASETVYYYLINYSTSCRFPAILHKSGIVHLMR